MICRRGGLAVFVVFSLFLGLFLPHSALRAESAKDSPFFNLRNRPAETPVADTTTAETGTVELKPDTDAAVPDTTGTGPETDQKVETSPLTADTESTVETAPALPDSPPVVPSVSPDTGLEPDSGDRSGEPQTPSATEGKPAGTRPEPAPTSAETEPGEQETQPEQQTGPADTEILETEPTAETEAAVAETATTSSESAEATTGPASQPDELTDQDEAPATVEKPETGSQSETSQPRAIPRPSEIPGPPFPEPMLAGLAASDSLPVQTENTTDSWSPKNWPTSDTTAGTVPLSTVRVGPEKSSNFGWPWNWLDWGAGVVLALGLIGLLAIYLRARSSGPRVFYSTSSGRTTGSTSNTTSSVSGQSNLTASTVPSQKKQKSTATTPAEASETSADQMPIWRYPDEKLKELGIDPEYRQVFKLYYGRRKTVEEIAEETDFRSGEIGLVLNLSELITGK